MPVNRAKDPNFSSRRKINSDVVHEALKNALTLLEEKLPEIFLFHSVDHTREVLKYTEIIGKDSSLDEDEMNILKISALFHDSGYIKSYKDHEKISAELARDFLENKQIDESQIKEVEKTILATKVPQNPTDTCSKILCDADLVNVTSDNYFKTAELMRLEWWKTGVVKMSEKEFHENSLNFFQSHKFHTEYGQKHFEPKKRLVLERIKKRIGELG